MARVPATIRSLTASLVLLAAGMVSLLAAAPALGAAFTVNTTADGNDFNTADPFCDADPGAPGEQCTLRAAIQQTDAQPGQDVVTLPAGTYTFQSDSIGSTPAVTDDLVIEGAGAATTTIRQTLAGRVLDIGPGASLDLRGATVRDGVLAASGGGIRNEGTLILRTSVVVGNQVFGSNGAGIWASPSATATRIFDSVIGTPAAPNIATGAGPGNPGGRGGGVAVEGGELEVRGSLIEANEANEETVQAMNGGGIFVQHRAVITDSTIRGNKANEGSGGGVYYTSPGGPGASLLVERTAITGNMAEICGGGIAAFALGVTGASILDSTVSGNIASNNAGAMCGSGEVQLTRSTIAANTDTPSDVPGLRWNSGTLTATASIFDNANDSNCYSAGGGFASGGSNIDSGSTCGFSAAESNVDPLLDPLADNGGPTLTHALRAGSPAIDRAGACGGTDQRGFPRSLGGPCDAGAYERVLCLGVAVNRVGTSAGGVVRGTTGDDAILTLDGNDDVQALEGNDRVCAAGGDDTIAGGEGNDVVDGGPGNDSLQGDGGDDALSGGDGNDTITGGPGNDSVLGHAGDDNLSGGDANDTAEGGPGNDSLLGDAGDDVLIGGPGKDVQRGGPGKDRLRGNAGADRQAGQQGNDRLAGGGGPDRQSGGPGRDTILGQGGNDRMGGGSARDRCNGGPGKKDRAAGSCEATSGVP